MFAILADEFAPKQVVRGWVDNSYGEPHSGCPKMATTADMLENVHRIVLDDRQVKVRIQNLQFVSQY